MITASYKERISIVNCLKDLDCCLRCIIRFLKLNSGIEKYTDPEAQINAILNETENHCTQKKTPVKKMKKNSCRICLNILEDETIKKFSENIKFTNIHEYCHPDFVIFTSFPKSLIIRDHCMCIYLRDSFPEFYSDFHGVDSINKVFKILSTEIISLITSKHCNPKSNLTLTFEVQYEDDILEIQNIRKLTQSMGKNQLGSKNVIHDILRICEDTLFKKYFTIPPHVPNKQTAVQISLMSEPMYIGGRYLKFSRDMGQTPWVIANKVLTQHNLQNTIFDSMEKILGYQNHQLTFCASGREDSDVRMLGNGRPFYIQIHNPRYECITFNQCRQIEMEIFNTKLAAIVKLQNINRNDIRKIKDGEQNKRKHYYALCQVNALDKNDVLNIINAYKNDTLEILQKTPLRVLHRRTQAVRKRHIYSMEAKISTGLSDCIEIKLITQAGTYVKEFINGDFERTQPNLKSILQHPIDVVALDVTNIDLSWPEE